jgi:hypothetical protein
MSKTWRLQIARECAVIVLLLYSTRVTLFCSGPREDATRIGSAGVVRRQAVDISPLRRVNQVGRGPRLCSQDARGSVAGMNQHINQQQGGQMPCIWQTPVWVPAHGGQLGGA